MKDRVTRKVAKIVCTAKAVYVLFIFTFFSCTFDYGDTEPFDSDMPDLVMQNVDYVRVRSADPVARIQAQRVERYEERGLMKLENFSFEQFGDSGESVNATGSAGQASVEIASGNILMDNGVWLEVDSEDIIIETYQINWVDEDRTMSSGEREQVNIFQDNGTVISGTGLKADTRRRTWEFAGVVTGTYVYEDD